MADARSMNQERIHLNQGFGRALSNAFEIAMVPAVFAAIGYGIDVLADSTPVFTIAVAALGLFGTVVKLVCAYNHEMKQHEAKGAWGRTVPAEVDR